NTEVRAVHQRFVTLQTPFFYDVELIVPTGCSYDDGQIGFKAQIDVCYRCFRLAEIDGYIGPFQISGADVRPIIFVHNEVDVMTALQGKFLNEPPHFSVSE